MKSINLENISIRALAEFIGKHLSKHGIDVVLVGGACVSIYTKNKYLSDDLDFITYETNKKIKFALKEIGFEYDRKKYYVHPECKFFLEFLTPPVAVGNEPIQTFNEISSSFGQIKILSPTDCVKDRLAAYIHWDDKQSLEQAIMVTRDQIVDVNEIKRWAKKEVNGNKKITEFLKNLEV